MQTFAVPTDPGWGTLLNLPRTRWYGDRNADWFGMFPCDECNATVVAVMEWQIGEFDEHYFRHACPACLPKLVTNLARSDALAEGTVIEVEVDPAWLRLTNTPSAIVDRFGTHSLGCRL